jgi:hypothetical protein
VIKEIKNGPATSKTASALPPALPRTQQEERERPKKGTDVPAGDSSSVSWHPSEAGAEGDGVQVVQATVLDRPGYAEMMKSALARIQVGEAGGAEAFAEMEQALKGLMDVSFKAKEPVLPAEFKTEWTCANVSIMECSGFLFGVHGVLLCLSWFFVSRLINFGSLVPSFLAS